MVLLIIPKKLGQREAPAIRDTLSCVRAAAARAIFICLFMFLTIKKLGQKKDNDKAS